jgi:hypothetical protein
MEVGMSTLLTVLLMLQGLVGVWQSHNFIMQFKDNATYTVRVLFLDGGEGTVEGTYTLAGDMITFTDNACGIVPGTYRYRREARAVVFELLGDACPSRAAALTNAPWTEGVRGPQV